MTALETQLLAQLTKVATIQEDMQRDLHALRAVVIGNGTSEAALVVRVDRLEQEELPCKQHTATLAIMQKTLDRNNDFTKTIKRLMWLFLSATASIIATLVISIITGKL
jgi:hypothetical protein